jgi:GT2 family glycosyltransferase
MISIIIPIIRPESAERCISAIKKNIGLPIDQYEIVSEMDTHEAGCPEMVKKLTEKAKYDLVMFLGDDTIPEPGFMKYALEAMESLPDAWGVVGLNTKPDNPLAHWLAHKKMLDHISGGAFFSTEYAHCWGDNELKDIAEELGRWVFAKEARIDHIHPINDSAPYDKHYQKAYSEKNRHHDFQTYCNRKRARMQKKYGTKLAIAMPLTDDKVYNQFFFSFIKVITEYMSSL